MLGCCRDDNAYGTIGGGYDAGHASCCTQSILAFALITSVALLLLGALSLVGCYYPGCALGVLGNTFGFTGACVITGVGGFFLISDILGCCSVNGRRLCAPRDRYVQIPSRLPSGIDNW